jgi:predicted DNA binding protein
MKALHVPSYEGTMLLSGGYNEKAVSEMFDVTFSFKHDCFYCNLSKEFPDATMIVCCNDKKDILEFVSSSERSVETAIKKLRNAGTEIERSDKGNRVVVVTDRCMCDLCVNETSIPADLGLLLLSPRVYSNGWEQRRILGFNNDHVRTIMKSLQENFPTKLIARKPVQGGLMSELFSPTSNELFGDMTDRQTEAMMLAFREGYYRSPRKVTTAKLARKFGTSRPTYEEHLRKAENKMIQTICGYMSLDATRSASTLQYGGGYPNPNEGHF